MMYKQSLSLILLSATTVTPALAQDNVFSSLQEEIQQARHRYSAAPESRLEQRDIEAMADQLMRAAGSAFERSQSIDPGLSIFSNPADSSSVLEIRGETGEILFNDGFAELRTETSTPGLPSATDAQGLAARHLNALGLLPENTSELRLEHVGGIRMGALQGDGTTAVFEKLVTVKFGRVLDGLRVEGPGSRLVVRIGENGRLAGVIRRWQPVQGELIPAAERLEVQEIQTLILERFKQMSASAVDSELTSAKVVLYDDGQGTVEPAVLVEGKLTLEGARQAGQAAPIRFENPVDFYIPIARDTKARFPFIKDRLIPTPENAKGR